MSDCARRDVHYIGLREDKDCVYFKVIAGEVAEARLLVQAEEDHCRPLEGSRRFSCSLVESGIEDLLDSWNNYIRPICGNYAIIQDIVEALVPPGVQFHLMARTITQHPCDPPSVYDLNLDEEMQLHFSLLELSGFVGRLDEFSRNAFPEGNNLKIYGAETADLLSSVCMSVESRLRESLRSNGISKSSYSTKDFYKLSKPMGLQDYGVYFKKMPWLGLYYPFKGWNLDLPTKSLSWYDAYNAVKHDRFKNRELASFENCILAISGLFCVLCGQYGVPQVQRSSKTISESMSIEEWPVWDRPHQYRMKTWDVSDAFRKVVWEKAPYGLA